MNAYNIILVICGIFILNGFIQLIRWGSKKETVHQVKREELQEEYDFEESEYQLDQRRSFTVRTSAEIERKVRKEARETNQTINAIICKALESYYKEKNK